MKENKHEAFKMIAEQEDQNAMMLCMDEVLYQHEQRNGIVANIILLDVVSWHKLQSLPDIVENAAMIAGVSKGKYKGIDVLLVTDPYYIMENRKPHGTVIMAGNRQ